MGDAHYAEERNRSHQRTHRDCSRVFEAEVFANVECRPVSCEGLIGGAPSWGAELVESGNSIARAEFSHGATDSVDDAGNVVAAVGAVADCGEDASLHFPVLGVAPGDDDFDKNLGRMSDSGDGGIMDGDRCIFVDVCFFPCGSHRERLELVRNT